MLLLILLINLHKISVPQGGTFLPQDHNLNKFGTGHRGDNNCEGFRHSGYRLERLPALHYRVDFIFLSFGIMGLIVEL